MMLSWSPVLAIKRAPADHDTQTCRLGPMLNYASICHFFMGIIFWLYQTQRLYIICVPDTNLTENIYGKSSFTAGLTQKNFPPPLFPLPFHPSLSLLCIP